MTKVRGPCAAGQDWTRAAPSTAGESAASNYASTRIAYYVSGLPLLAFLAPAILEAIKRNCGAHPVLNGLYDEYCVLVPAPA